MKSIKGLLNILKSIVEHVIGITLFIVFVVLFLTALYVVPMLCLYLLGFRD